MHTRDLLLASVQQGDFTHITCIYDRHLDAKDMDHSLTALTEILLFRPESRADIPESSLQPDVVPVHCMNMNSCVTRKRRFYLGFCVFGLVEALQIREGGDGEER